MYVWIILYGICIYVNIYFQVFYFPVGLIGQTWFINCLFFIKLLPQKWQVPVLLVIPDDAGVVAEFEWLIRVELPGLLNNIILVFEDYPYKHFFWTNLSANVDALFCTNAGSKLLLTSEIGGLMNSSIIKLSIGIFKNLYFNMDSIV